MREFFEPTALSAGSLDLVRQAIAIIDDYRRQGYDLSLRQCYYQLVSRNVIPNTDKSYKRLGSIISDARLCGYIDWSMIVDRGRSVATPSHLAVNTILNRAPDWFSKDLWDDQPWYMMVMVEKDALSGVLEPVCDTEGITFAANKGYSSSSSMYRIGKKIKDQMDIGKNICVCYLGDHDPSGIDMTRDVEDRLKLFSGYTFWQPSKSESEDKAYYDKAIKGMNPRHFTKFKNADYSHLEFEVKRLALNMDQVQDYNPPPNPAKLDDSRAAAYIDEFGEESWELDALEPSILASLVTEAVEEKRDQELWEAAEERMEAERARFQLCLDSADRSLL
jgi:hypothetical protein